MNHFTIEQVAQLAPDAASLKAGRDLANARKWLSFSINERVLWGEVQGSGKDPYRTQVDLEVVAFKCSCPSRKFPCKHGLGLMFLLVSNPDSFKNTTEPEWVADWIGKRREKAENASQSDVPESVEVPDKAAEKRAKDKAKRADNRMALVQAGAAELELMLRDLLRTGILSVPEKGAAFYEKTVRRMIDAKATGLANWVRNFNKINYVSDQDWHETAFENATKIWLLLDAFRNIAQLDAPEQEQIRSLIGWTYTRKDLLDDPSLKSIEDDWLPLGKITEQLDDEVTTMHRTWLYGLQSGQTALIMDFVTPFNPADDFFPIGVPLRANLVYYPSNYPLRAQFKSRGVSQAQNLHNEPFANWAAAQGGLAETLALSPWADDIPQFLGQLVLVKDRDRWFLKDQENRIVALAGGYSTEQVWQLLAISGGKPCDIWLLRRGKEAFPLGVFAGNFYKVLYNK